MNSRPTVEDLDRPLRVLAGPGAGKTQLLVDLYADLVRGGYASRSQILVLTFSNAAAEELGRRIDELLRDSYDQAWVSTFHSFCLRLLRDHRPSLSLLMSGFQERVAMGRVLSECGEDVLGELDPLRRSAGMARDALSFIALLKQNRVHPSELALLTEIDGSPRLRALGRLYRAYQDRLEAAGLQDFRDLVNEAIALLDARPDVLRLLRQRFRYVLVDEFQDVDPAQFDLLRLLAAPGAGPRLLVAGDPDQSIYGFRGTLPRLFSGEFCAVYGDRSFVIDRSHRCPPALLEAGRRVLERETGTEPLDQAHLRWLRSATGVDEATSVAREILRLRLERPELRWSRIAVLLRSTTAQAAPFEHAMRAHGVPAEVRGTGGLHRNEVVRFLLAYLRALHDADADGALEQALSSGLAGIGPRAIGRLRRHGLEEGRAFAKVVHRLVHWLARQDPETYPLPWPAKAPEPVVDQVEPDGERPASRDPDYAAYLSDDERRSIHAAVTSFTQLRSRARRLPVQALAYAVLLEIGVLRRLVELSLTDDDGERARGDLRAAMGAIADLEAVWTRLHGAPPTLAEVVDDLEGWLGLALDETEPAPASRDAIQLMTVHQAKGLEFEYVFLSGFARGVFPLAARTQALLEPEDQTWLMRNLSGFRPSWPDDPEAQLAEEARVAYVGITRARERLYLTAADRYDEQAGPSPFAERIQPELPETLPAVAVRTAEDVLNVEEAETLLAGRTLDGMTRERLLALGVDLAWTADPLSGQPYRPYLERASGVDPGHFSPTSLNDYLKCPRLYFYNHHPGIAAPSRTVELERGSFLHTVLEEFHKHEGEWRTGTADEQRSWLVNQLESELGEYLDQVENVLDRRVEEREVRRIMENYIQFTTRGQPIRRLGTLTTERKFFLDVDGAEVRGKIDRIIDTGGGTCEVVDYKTGRGSGIQKTYERYFGPELSDVQLIMYQLACREGRDEDGNALGLRPRYLSLWYPKDVVYNNMRQSLFPVGEATPGVPDRSQHPVSEVDLQRGRDRVTDAIHRIRAGDFTPEPRADVIGTCTSWFGCPHQSVCPFGGTNRDE